MGAGILVKGPVLPVMAALTLASLCLWHRQVAWLLSILRFWRGFALILLLCMPWAILVTIATDGEFLTTAIKGDFLAKIIADRNHGAPPGDLCASSWYIDMASKSAFGLGI